MAMVNAGLDRIDDALECLEKAMAQREPHLILMGAHSGLDPLREETRFRRLLEKLNLRPD